MRCCNSPEQGYVLEHLNKGMVCGYICVGLYKLSIAGPSKQFWSRAFADFLLNADENPVNPRRECCGKATVQRKFFVLN